jgi:hypothetical protein
LGVPLLFWRGAPLCLRSLRGRSGLSLRSVLVVVVLASSLRRGFRRLFLWGFPMSSLSFVRASAPVFVPFAPASLSLGRAGSVPASRFVPVASGVVSFVGWCPRRRGLLVSLASGASFCCLVSGLPGGFGGPAAVALAASLRSARASGVVVSVLGAPGSRGSVCPGYFCGLAVPPSLGERLSAELAGPEAFVFRSARA